MIKLFDSNMKEIIPDITTYQISIFPLDNFSAFGLIMDGLYFPTSEHAFQYLKFIDTNPKLAEEIRLSLSPNEARTIAHDNPQYKSINWANIKYEKMEKVLRLKVDQNDVVKKKLLGTGNNIIAEYCTDEDTDWGLDSNQSGENNLGKILMKIRQEL